MFIKYFLYFLGVYSLYRYTPHTIPDKITEFTYKKQVEADLNLKYRSNEKREDIRSAPSSWTTKAADNEPKNILILPCKSNVMGTVHIHYCSQ